MRGDGLQSWQAAAVFFDSDDMLRTFCKQRTGEAARPWPNFNNGHTFQRSGLPRDPPGEVHIENEILPQRFFCGERKRGYHLA
jgi:hypothetical protein